MLICLFISKGYIVIEGLWQLKQIVLFARLSPQFYLSLLYNSPAKLILISVLEKRVVEKLVYCAGFVTSRVCEFLTYNVHQEYAHFKVVKPWQQT